MEPSTTITLCLERAAPFGNIVSGDTIAPFVIASEGFGIWGNFVVDAIVRILLHRRHGHAAPTIKWENTDTADLMVRSCFDNPGASWMEHRWTDRRIPYILWCGEPIEVYGRPGYTELFTLKTFDGPTPSGAPYFCVPYCTMAFPYARLRTIAPLNTPGLGASLREYAQTHESAPRPRLVAYCARKPMEPRDRLFRECYAAGKRAGKAGAVGTSLAIDGLGAASNTGIASPEGAWNSEGLIATYSQYQFVFAMENTALSGYITEKIINAYKAGAVPIYWGDVAGAKRIFNPESFVDASQFQNGEELFKYLWELSNDRDRYMKMATAYPFNSPTLPDIFDLDNLDNPFYGAIAGALEERMAL